MTDQSGLCWSGWAKTLGYMRPTTATVRGSLFLVTFFKVFLPLGLRDGVLRRVVPKGCMAEQSGLCRSGWAKNLWLYAPYHGYGQGF